MAKVTVDGVEVDTEPDSEAEENSHEDGGYYPRSRFQAPPGKTTRQHIEGQLSSIFGTAWDYMTGEGDDLDRALRMIDKHKRGR